MKKLIIGMTVFMSFACSLFAGLITVDYNAGPGLRDVTDSSLTALPIGNTVSIGYFDNGFDVVANANNLVALGGAFNEFDSTSIQTIFGQAGRFADNASVDAPVFMDGVNEQIYLFAFNTTANNAPVGDFSNVTGYGLFTNDTLSNWLFPDTVVDPIFTTTMITSSEVNQALFGSFDGNHLILGDVAAIPEPSTWFLLVFGLSALGYFKRRAN